MTKKVVKKTRRKSAIARKYGDFGGIVGNCLIKMVESREGAPKRRRCKAKKRIR